MLKRFEQFIDKHALCTRDKKIILAVSGGLDSMIMLDLFRKASYAIIVAHVNFQLRGGESDRDEAFVKEYCEKSGVPFHSRRVETNNYATQQKLSIQMAARELRYRWFKELVNDRKGDLVATAHHLGDSVETMLLRLVHGIGNDGLTGIPVVNGNIIRPLMFTTRRELEEYAAANAIVWREDMSNHSLDYQRNIIRHLVLPSLRLINPALEETFQRTSLKAKGEEELIDIAIRQWSDRFVVRSDEGLDIQKEVLKELNHPEVLLMRLIGPFGFNFSNCLDIVDAIHGQPGKTFLTATHQLVVDRDKLIVRPAPIALETVSIQMNDGTSSLGPFQLSIHERAGNSIDTDPSIAVLDKDKVSFPLQWRMWAEGDFFFPLGMKGRKKVSDFLIDMKLSLPEKQSVTVIESEKKIVWLPGLRIDDRFKVTAETRTSLVLSLRKTPA